MRRLIAPSILSFDLLGLAETVPNLIDAGADIIHLDVMDGRFVPPITFGDNLARSLRARTDAFLEVHLMTEAPEDQFEAFAEAGCERILFHLEATHHAHRHVQTLRKLGVSPGVVLDYNEANQVVGIEMLHLSRRSPQFNFQKLQFQTA
ncbi:DUF2283 domain-containing protein [bacterium]|nr:MAG: DUF2283 domain-containing protein [bacterium]